MTFNRLFSFLLLFFSTLSMFGQIKYDMPRNIKEYEYLFNLDQEFEIYAENKVKSLIKYEIDPLTKDTLSKDYFSFLENGLRDSCYSERKRNIEKYDKRNGYKEIGLDSIIVTHAKFRYNSHELIREIKYRTEYGELLPMAPHKECDAFTSLKYDSLNRLIYSSVKEWFVFNGVESKKLRKNLFYSDSASYEKEIIHYGDTAHLEIKHALNDFYSFYGDSSYTDSTLYKVSYSKLSEYQLNNQDFVELDSNELIKSWIKTRMYSGLGDRFRGYEHGNSKRTYEYNEQENITCIYTMNPLSNFIGEEVSYTYHDNSIIESTTYFRVKYSFWNIFRSKEKRKQKRKYLIVSKNPIQYVLYPNGLLKSSGPVDTEPQFIYEYEYWN